MSRIAYQGCVCGGGGGTQIFSVYVGSDPASTPQKYQEFQANKMDARLYELKHV